MDYTPAVAANRLLLDRRVRALVAKPLLEDLHRVVLTDREPEYVLLGDLGAGFTYERLDRAFRHLEDGAELVALQKNRYWQQEAGLSLDAGSFVVALEYASRKEATIIGKPEKGLFRGRAWGSSGPKRTGWQWSGTMRRRTWPGRGRRISWVAKIMVSLDHSTHLTLVCLANRRKRSL